MKLNKKAFQKWSEWIEKIKSDLSTIIDRHQIYDYFHDVVNNNLDHIRDHNGMLFCKFINDCYFIQAALAIRRHIKDKEDNSISLIKLLKQIKMCANQFTYEFYLSIFPIQDWEWQEHTFKNFSTDGISISAEKIDDDIQYLSKVSKKVSDIVDQYFAHLDKRNLYRDEKLTLSELNESIDTFNKITCKYMALLTSKGYLSLESTIQFDWQEIFHVPLDIRKFDEI